MRIVIDLQSLQTTSRKRGIGHYTNSLVKEIISCNRDHEIVLLVNNFDKKGIEELCLEYDSIYDVSKIKVFSALDDSIESCADNLQRIQISEIIRNSFVKDLEPDFLLITSLFEGASENFVCSIDQERNYKVGVIGYDLIPLINEDMHLNIPEVKSWYYRKLEELKKSDYIFSISESAKSEFEQYLKLSPNIVKNISSACSADYTSNYCNVRKQQLFSNLSIEKKFILYSGACDERKNLSGLLNAYSELDKDIRQDHQIVLVGNYNETDRIKLRKDSRNKGLSNSDIIFSGYISNEDLNILYNTCQLFVFPSFHEGFGLPVLEAMTCGAPVICSNCSSLPEVIGLKDAMFDPYNISDINEKMLLALTDINYRQKLIENAKEQSLKFSWQKTASTLIDYIDNVSDKLEKNNLSYDENQSELIETLSKIIYKEKIDEITLKEISNCIADNDLYNPI